MFSYAQSSRMKVDPEPTSGAASYTVHVSSVDRPPSEQLRLPLGGSAGSPCRRSPRADLYTAVNFHTVTLCFSPGRSRLIKMIPQAPSIFRHGVMTVLRRVFRAPREVRFKLPALPHNISTSRRSTTTRASNPPFKPISQRIKFKPIERPFTSM